jgi:uncharacterized protein (DUF2342 family)
VRSVDLAIYADTLAAEAAAISARAERARSRLRESAIEREARRALDRQTVERLERLGLLRPADEPRLSAALHRLEADLSAVEKLQAWIEARLGD